MRRNRECYLLIREIRVASSWLVMDGRVFPVPSQQMTGRS
jgi:hypothetical protein